MKTRKQEIKELETFLGFSLRSPSKNDLFNFFWDIYIYDVACRNNFKQSHLLQLKTLCDLHVDEDRLCKVIDEKGYSFIAYSKSGEESERPLPEVTLLLRTRGIIKEYTKMMGLLLHKDVKTNEPEEEKDFI